MNTLKNKRCLFFVLLCFLQLTGCKKFLEEKSNKNLAIPTTLTDFQALLDSYTNINTRDIGSGEVSADNYYLGDAEWNAQAENYRRMYLWEKDNVFASGLNDWNSSYGPLFYCNTVLEGLDKLSGAGGVEADNIRGQAGFWRARSFLQLLFQFCLAFDETTAAADLGVPLRLNADFNEVSTRASVKQSYEQVLRDLKTAAPLLPLTPLSVTRPCRPAAYGMLARAYLAMRQYDSCLKYADLTLQARSSLLDYNSLSAAATNPVAFLNTEVILESSIPFPSPLGNTRAKIDSALYNSYSANDLRKVVFFRSNGNGTYGFKGSYEGSANLFSGLATDEMYLMRAECRARSGNPVGAMADLNTLLSKRWKSGTYVPFMAINSADALTKILEERRKELLMRGLRWMDLKRLNREGAAITLFRKINGQSYTLPPNDLRYALPIPEDVISLTGMPQNPR